jgi:hypothetical protein
MTRGTPQTRSSMGCAAGYGFGRPAGPCGRTWSRTAGLLASIAAVVLTTGIGPWGAQTAWAATASFTVSPPFINIFVAQNDGAGPAPVAVTLTGQGGTSISYELTFVDRDWFSVSKTSGTIPAGGSDSFQVQFYPNAVLPGRYSAVIHLDNLTNPSASTEISLTMVVSSTHSGAVVLSPDADIVLRGPEGRLTPLATQGATLHNGSDRFILWQAIVDQSWISVSPTGGELAPAGEIHDLDTQALDIRPNVAVNNLAAGAYIATVTFQNLTTSVPIATRVAHLIVDPLLDVAASVPETIITVVPAEQMRVDSRTGPRVYELGDVVTMLATVPDGYQFLGWYLDGQDGDTETIEDNPAVITMYRSRKATALVQPLMRTLTLSASGDGTGTTTTSPTGQVIDNELVSHYSNTTEVELRAEPNDGSVFAGWSGVVPAGDELDNPITVVMDRDRVITARFEIGVTLDVATSGLGAVEVEPNQAVYAAGAEVTLTPIPAEGQKFAGWSGGATGSDSPLVLTIEDDTSITARFVAEGDGSGGPADTFSLTVEVSGSGEVSPSGGDYPAGADVLLVATPGLGARFVSWEGDATGTEMTTELIMDADRHVQAIFEPDTTDGSTDGIGRPLPDGTGIPVCGTVGLLGLPLTLLGLALMRGIIPAGDWRATKTPSGRAP